MRLAGWCFYIVLVAVITRSPIYMGLKQKKWLAGLYFVLEHKNP